MAKDFKNVARLDVARAAKLTRAATAKWLRSPPQTEETLRAAIQKNKDAHQLWYAAEERKRQEREQAASSSEAPASDPLHAYLLGLMRTNREGPPEPKLAIQAHCKAAFGTGRRIFERAWDVCVDAAKADGWRKRGPKGPHKARKTKRR